MVSERLISYFTLKGCGQELWVCGDWSLSRLLLSTAAKTDDFLTSDICDWNLEIQK